jgi:hypothetical protein
MPTGAPVRQVVFGHQTDGQFNHAIGVKTPLGAQIAQIRAEVEVTQHAVVLGIMHLRLAWLATARISQIV